jgi:glycerophosphoryl diester phosphodiesterase
MSGILVIGHRGAAGLAPENTLTGFTRALEIGVDGVELDVLLTADREVVVYHDLRLKPEITRTADGMWLEGPWGPAIRDLTVAELKTYDVGRLRTGTPYSRRYPEQQAVDGERIPTLREVISLLRRKGDSTTQLWVEIKTSPEEPELTESPEVVADAVLEVLRQQRLSHRVHILSFDWRSLVHVQETAPEMPTVYLSMTARPVDTVQAGKPGPSPWAAGLDLPDFNGSMPRTVSAAGGRYWAPHYREITPALVREAHQLGIKIAAWPPDFPPDMILLIEMGVDGIITNRPDILASLCSPSYL